MRYLLFRPHLAAFLPPALSFPVLAQSSVNIGGTVDIGIYRDAADDGGWGEVDVDGVTAEKVLGTAALHTPSKRTSVYADFAHKQFVDDRVNVYGAGVAHPF